MNPGLLRWECGVLAPGPPGKAPCSFILPFFLSCGVLRGDVGRRAVWGWVAIVCSYVHVLSPEIFIFCLRRVSPPVLSLNLSCPLRLAGDIFFQDRFLHEAAQARPESRPGPSAWRAEAGVCGRQSDGHGPARPPCPGLSAAPHRQLGAHGGLKSGVWRPGRQSSEYGPSRRVGTYIGQPLGSAESRWIKNRA